MYTFSKSVEVIRAFFFAQEGKYIDIHVIIGIELYGVTVECHTLDQNVLGLNPVRFFPSARKLTTIASPNSGV